MLTLLIASFCSMQFSMSPYVCIDKLKDCVEKDVWTTYEESNYTEVPNEKTRILALQFCVDNWEEIK